MLSLKSLLHYILSRGRAKDNMIYDCIIYYSYSMRQSHACTMTLKRQHNNVVYQ